MKKEIIWRVENEFGEGPYRSRRMDIAPLLFRAFHRKPALKDRWPLPWEDAGLKGRFNAAAVNPRSFSAFNSLKQYERWFASRELQDLLHHTGYFLVKYETPSLVWHGETQALFFGREDVRPIAYRACNAAGIYDKPFHGASRRYYHKRGAARL